MDKVGIWAAIEILKKYKDVNVVFFSNEEKGCIGSSAIDLNVFSNANWLIQLDRRNNNDFICGDMSSDEFQKDCKPLFEKYGYTLPPYQTTITDVSKLIDRGLQVSAVNISCGYYNPHSDKEYVNTEDAISALFLTIDMIDNIGANSYKYTPKPVYNTKYYNNSYNDVDDFPYKNNSYHSANKYLTQSVEDKIKDVLKSCFNSNNFIHTDSYIGVLSLDEEKLNIFKERYQLMYKTTVTIDLASKKHSHDKNKNVIRCLLKFLNQKNG